MNHQTIIVLDFGGQYNQLIARRVRECGVYCEVKPYTTPLANLLAMKPIGFIFTGGPNSVYLEDAPHVDPALFDAGVPVLGICYGCQLIAHHLGGKVVAANDATAREYGKTETFFDTNCKLFKGLPEKSVTWMSHGDYMEKVPEGFSLVAHSDACPNVAICDETRGFYGVQFHPEVNHTEHGQDMIRNFLYEVCGATGDWTMGDYKNTAIAAVREKVGSGRVLLALSGGVDSSVVAALLICNLGLTNIIALASPILSVVCPPFMTTVVLLLFRKHLRGTWVFKGAALAAVAASLLLTVHDLTGAFAFVEAAPLYAYGFAWLLPSLIGGVGGALLGRRFDSAASG